MKPSPNAPHAHTSAVQAGTKAVHYGNSTCTVISEMLSRIGDKWSVLVVTQLGTGTLRFSELKKRIGPFSYLDHKAMFERAGQLFAELKSETRPRDLVKKMSGGQRQAVAIARTRLSNAKLVLMDEPTAAISVRQVAEVLGLIKRMKAQGMAVILISHRMPDVFAVCDRIIVMRRGTKVADKKTADTSPEEITGLITGAILEA